MRWILQIPNNGSVSWNPSSYCVQAALLHATRLLRFYIRGMCALSIPADPNNWFRPWYYLLNNYVLQPRCLSTPLAEFQMRTKSWSCVWLETIPVKNTKLIFCNIFVSLLWFQIFFYCLYYNIFGIVISSVIYIYWSYCIVVLYSERTGIS